MSLLTKNKFTPLNHKDDLARNYQSVQSPKHCASPASTIGTKESPKRSSFSHTETHRFMSTPLINVQGVLSSSGNYKDKRPLEIFDVLDHERPRSLNVSTPSAHNVTPKSNYDMHDISAMKASFLTNKTGSYKSEGKSPVLEIDSNFSSTKVYTTPQKSNKTTYLAEKVYSMKMKGVSHLTSIMPLSKTRSPGNFPLSTKNGSAVSSNSRNELKDNDIPSPTLSPLKSDHGYYSQNERSYTSAMHEELSTPKKTGLSGQKSLGKLLNTTKSTTTNMKNESLLLKGNKTPVKRSPVPEKKGFTEKSKQATANTANTSRTYRPGSGQKTPVKSRNVEVLQARANRFVEKLNGVFWQINQRNKRVVLVNMLELLHQYQLRVTDYLEHKKLLTKSKYFCMWQEYLLEINREKQRIIQNSVEDKKMAIAGAFYNSKVLRKVFSKLQIYKLPEFKTQPTPQPQAQFFNKTPSKSPNTSRHPSVPSIYQTKSTTLNIPSQIKTSRTPQTPQPNLNKSKFLTTRDKSPNDSRGLIKPDRISTPKPSTYSPLSNRSQSVGKVLKEMNSTSMIVSGTRTPKTPATPSRANTPQRQKKPVTGNTTPTKNQKDSGVPRFGKSVSMIQDPMESVDYTKVLRSPEKTPKEKDLDQSFGYKNANNSYEKGGEMFDSILAEILHVPETNVSHDIPSRKNFLKEEKNNEKIVSPFKQSQQQQESRRPNTSNDAYFSAVEAAKKTTVSSATVKRNNITPKTAVPPKTTRDYTPPKVNKTVSRDPSLTSRTRQEEKKKNEIIKKGITINSTPQKVSRTSAVPSKSSSQQHQHQQKSFMQEDIEDKEDELKMQKAINHRRKVLLQNAFVWLLASYIQSSEELLEGMTKAQYHYENNLKIKGLSAFLENFVTSFKERQLLETELLSDEMHGGSAPKVESDEQVSDDEEEEEEDDTYDLIISRFRFIVLTEKAMRGFKQNIPPKKKKAVPATSYKYKGKGY